MSVKNEKIMIFVGSAEAKVFADSLAEYTDSVYAVVSERYGSRQHVSGNITVISRFLDKDSIKSWVARVGVSVLVDGTEVYASASSRMIRETAEELGLDYFKISSSIDVDFTHTSKCKNAEEIVKDASYTVGNVLLIGCSELAEDVVTKRDGALRDRVVAVLPPEEENIRMCREAGYPPENIICMTVPAAGNPAAWTHRRQKYHTYGSFGGRYARSKSNLRAAEAANIKISLYGELRQPEGMMRGTALEYFCGSPGNQGALI